MLYEVRHYIVKKNLNESRQQIVKQRWCILFCFCIMTNCKRDRFNIVCKDNIGKILVINILEKKPSNRNSNCFLRRVFGECYEIFL